MRLNVAKSIVEAALVRSTTTGRLLFDLGGLPERELEKLKQEA